MQVKPSQTTAWVKGHQVPPGPSPKAAVATQLDAYFLESQQPGPTKRGVFCLREDVELKRVGQKRVTASLFGMKLGVCLKLN